MPTAPSHFESTFPGIAVLTSDTMMFQRDDPSPSDPHLNNFFALALPLIKQGIPAKVVQLETLPTPSALKGIGIILMSYEGTKPLDPAYHRTLTDWVRIGGTLIIIDDQHDPYNKMRAWWNTPPNNYPSPLAHLLKSLNVHPDATDASCGHGRVLIERASPAELAHDPNGAHRVLEQLQRARGWRGQPKLQPQSHLILHRGPYVIAANVDESTNTKPATITGTFVDLFDANLPVVTNPTIAVGEVKLLREVGNQPEVLASASRIRNVTITNDQITFESEGPENTHCVTRVRLSAKPKSIQATDASNAISHQSDWDEESSTLLLRYDNRARPLLVTIK